MRQIAADFQIVVSTMYVWIKMFQEHYDLLLGKLETSSSDIKKPLQTVLGKSDLTLRLFIFVET